MLEEGQSNTYINQRGEAIEAIERTINELGGIFGQLAEMVSAQVNYNYTRSSRALSDILYRETRLNA